MGGQNNAVFTYSFIRFVRLLVAFLLLGCHSYVSAIQQNIFKSQGNLLLNVGYYTLLLLVAIAFVNSRMIYNIRTLPPANFSSNDGFYLATRPMPDKANLLCELWNNDNIRVIRVY